MEINDELFETDFLAWCDEVIASEREKWEKLKVEYAEGITVTYDDGVEETFFVGVDY